MIYPAAIIVPIYKEEITDLEKESLLQLFKILGHHPVFLMTHQDLDMSLYHQVLVNFQYNVSFFNSRYFKSINGYNKLLMSRRFYSRFKKSFKFILLYQLDAWVFSDKLDSWCNAGYDYIGAPWFSSDRPESSLPHFMGIGNGGFSLRKVQSHLKVLNMFSFIVHPRYYWGQLFRKPGMESLKSLFLNVTINNNTHYLLGKNDLNEDVFWSRIISKYKWFKAPAMMVASSFSTEMCAEKLYYINNKALPFGCHAWDKYESDFWKQFIKV